MTVDYSGRRVLVTGGMGFLGSHVARALLDCGASVAIVDLPDAGLGANRFNLDGLDGRIQVHAVDIRDAGRMEPLVRDAEIVFCLAGQVSHPLSMSDPFADLDINCRGLLVLLELCRAVNRDIGIVFAGTRQIYGRPDFLPVTESHPVRPVDVNGVSRLAAENLLRVYNASYGIRSTCLRLTNTYGPRMDLRSPGRGVVPVFVARALRGQTLSIFGNGRQQRDFNYVDDVVQALLLAGEFRDSSGSAFNLGFPVPASLLDLVEELGRILPLDYELVPFPEDRQLIDIGDYVACTRRFSELTGWSPTTDLRSGLRKTIEFFLTHKSQYL